MFVLNSTHAYGCICTYVEFIFLCLYGKYISV